MINAFFRTNRDKRTKTISADSLIDLDELDKIGFNYALEWFKYHANQRYQSFHNFAIQVFTLPLALVGTFIINHKLADTSFFWKIVAIALALNSWLSYLFFRLDRRNEHLVKLGENKLKLYEVIIFKRKSGILIKDESENPESGMLYSHSKILILIFSTVILFFLFTSYMSLIYAIFFIH